MALVVTNLGEVLMLGTLVTELFGTLTLRLFQNDITPDAETETADFDEADFPGYASIDLDDWSSAVEIPSGEAETVEQTRIFTATGSSPANDVYGYYVTNGSGVTVWAERFAAMQVVNGSGDEVAVLPRFRFASQD